MSASSVINSATTKLIPVSSSPAVGTHIAKHHATLSAAPATTPTTRPHVFSTLNSMLAAGTWTGACVSELVRCDDDRGREQRKANADAQARADRRADGDVAEQQARDDTERRAPKNCRRESRGCPRAEISAPAFRLASSRGVLAALARA